MTRVGVLVGIKPIGAQVFPRWILSLDEYDFLFSSPAFELLFALNGRAHFGETFKPDEPVAIVFRCESGVDLVSMLQDSGAEVAGEADVESSAFAGDDVREI
jgi:hypothetical protein